MKARNVYRAVVADLGIGRRDERRLVGHALYMWWRLKGERTMPSLADIPFGDKAVGHDARLGPYLFAVTVASSDEDVAILHCGEILADICGRDVTGEMAAQCLPPTIWEKLRYTFSAAAIAAKPLLASGRFAGKDGGRYLFRSIILPLGADPKTVDHLLCAINFKPAPP
ncbi:MAG: hypothetical protein WCF16_05255 [Alphaproteobacteria bacterium]